MRRTPLLHARAIVLIVAVLATLIPLSQPAAAQTSAEQAFVSKINGARAASGLGPLTTNSSLAGVARSWSRVMASGTGLAHNPNMASQITAQVTRNWTAVGENVGYTTNAQRAGESTLVSRIHEAFMNSAGHRKNILGPYNQVGVGVVVQGHGTMWVTVNFMQAPLASAAKPRWSGWNNLAGGVRYGPAAVSWGANRTDLFAVDTAGRLVHRHYTSAGWYGAWKNLGAPGGLTLTSAPAVTSERAGTLDVFARASDNALWRRAYRPGSGWSSWQKLGGVLGSGPGAVSYISGNVTVFVEGSRGQLWQRSLNNGRWSRWIRLGGSISAAPAATSWQPGRLDLVARGANGKLWHRAYVVGSGWSKWHNLGGVLANGVGPAITAPERGRLEIGVVGSTGKAHPMTYDRGWSRFGNLGKPSTGSLRSSIAMSSMSASQLEVFSLGGGGTVSNIWRQ